MKDKERVIVEDNLEVIEWESNTLKQVITLTYDDTHKLTSEKVVQLEKSTNEITTLMCTYHEYYCSIVEIVNGHIEYIECGI